MNVANMTVDTVEVGQEVEAHGRIVGVGPIDDEGLRRVTVRFNTADYEHKSLTFFAWLSEDDSP